MLSQAISIAKEREIKVPVINTTAEDIKELMSYYMFTVKQRVAVNNHHEALNYKDGNVYALKDLKKRIKELKLKEAEILEKIKDMMKSHKVINSREIYLQNKGIIFKWCF